jgi:hypothetical protein
VTGQAPSSAAIERLAGPRAGLGKAGLEKTVLGRAGLVLAMTIPMGLLAGRRRKWKRLVLAGLLVFLLPVGCNLGVTPGKQSPPTGSNPPPGGASNPTPSGTYTLTVTGTAPGLSHSVTLTLMVE